MNWAGFFWLALLVLFLFVEAQTVALVSSWFAVGALAALITSVLGAQIWLQTTIFFVVSIALLLALRPLLRRFVTPRIVKTNVDALVGAKCYVTAAIDNISSTGQIKLNGMEWTARSTSGRPIEAGTLVTVDRIEGVKAFVSPAETKVKEEVNL